MVFRPWFLMLRSFFTPKAVKLYVRKDVRGLVRAASKGALPGRAEAILALCDFDDLEARTAIQESLTQPDLVEELHKKDRLWSVWECAALGAHPDSDPSLFCKMIENRSKLIFHPRYPIVCLGRVGGNQAIASLESLARQGLLNAPGEERWISRLALRCLARIGHCLKPLPLGLPTRDDRAREAIARLGDSSPLMALLRAWQDHPKEWDVLESFEAFGRGLLEWTGRNRLKELGAEPNLSDSHRNLVETMLDWDADDKYEPLVGSYPTRQGEYQKHLEAALCQVEDYNPMGNFLVDVEILERAARRAEDSEELKRLEGALVRVAKFPKIFGIHQSLRAFCMIGRLGQPHLIATLEDLQPKMEFSVFDQEDSDYYYSGGIEQLAPGKFETVRMSGLCCAYPQPVPVVGDIESLAWPESEIIETLRNATEQIEALSEWLNAGRRFHPNCGPHQEHDIVLVPLDYASRSVNSADVEALISMPISKLAEMTIQDEITDRRKDSGWAAAVALAHNGDERGIRRIFRAFVGYDEIGRDVDNIAGQLSDEKVGQVLFEACWPQSFGGRFRIRSASEQAAAKIAEATTADDIFYALSASRTSSQADEELPPAERQRITQLLLALGKKPRSESGALLLQAMDHPQDEIRFGAACLALQLGEIAAGVDKLSSCLVDERQAFSRRQRCIEILVQLPTNAGLETVLRCLRTTRNADIRRACAQEIADLVDFLERKTDD